MDHAGPGSGPQPAQPVVSGCAERAPDLVPVTSLEFRALGTSCRVVVGGGPDGLAEAARDMVEDLERRWSRFRPDSEISQLNARTGQVTIVSEPTFKLLRCAQQAREATGGRFNPLLLDQMEAIGYRRSWPDAGAEGNSGDADEDRCQPGTSEPIDLLPEICGARLPAGSRFDPGGIGKGLAVDMAMAWCIDQGATTACIDLGGDVRVHGQPWYGPHWRIGIEHPFDPAVEVASFTPTAGAVTTSSTLRRTWEGRDHRLHHIIDPRTGTSSASDLVAVSTCSSLAWWAEVAAKTAIIAGAAQAPELLRQLDTPGIAVTGDGLVLTLQGASTLNGVGAGRTAA